MKMKVPRRSDRLAAEPEKVADAPRQKHQRAQLKFLGLAAYWIGWATLGLRLPGMSADLWGLWMIGIFFPLVTTAIVAADYGKNFPGVKGWEGIILFLAVFVLVTWSIIQGGQVSTQANDLQIEQYNQQLANSGYLLQSARDVTCTSYVQLDQAGFLNSLNPSIKTILYYNDRTAYYYQMNALGGCLWTKVG